MDTLGKRIAYFRKQKGVSQEKVAEYIGISRQAVTKWENDNSRPNTENLLQLSSLFNISLDELISIPADNHAHGRKAARVDKNGLLKDRIRIIIPIFLFTCGMNLLGISFQTNGADGSLNRGFWLFSFLSVLIPACFMDMNILCDKELDRARAARIEFCYVLLQAVILLFGWLAVGNIISLILSALAFWYYIVKINGRKLNRPLIEKPKS